MTNSDAWFYNICICLSHQMRGWCVKAASHLFICVPGKQPEAGQPEEASFLTLPDRTDNGECLCVQDTVINKVQTTPHQTDIILVGSDLLVVWRARQHPPGCNPTAGGLGCAVITWLTAPHQQQSERCTDGEHWYNSVCTAEVLFSSILAQNRYLSELWWELLVIRQEQYHYSTAICEFLLLDKRDNSLKDLPSSTLPPGVENSPELEASNIWLKLLSLFMVLNSFIRNY